MARDRASYVGVPAIFELNAACVLINKALGPDFGCYHVGSSLQRRDYRDVDVRYIMEDARYSMMFNEKMPEFVCPTDATHPIADEAFCPTCRERVKIKQHYWHFEHNPLWALMSVAFSHWLSLRTGLPIDFQIQPQSWANEKYGRPEHERNPLGLYIRGAA